MAITKKTRFFFLLSLFLLISTTTEIFGQQPSTSGPAWLRKGAFAQYEFKSNLAILQNDTIFIANASTNVKWNWQCIEINGTMAKVNLAMHYAGGVNMSFLTEAYIDLADRRVFTLNGTLVGTTTLWLPDNPLPNDEVILWDVFPDKISSQIKDTPLYSQTPQGRQKVFRVEGFGRIRNQTVTIIGIYDFDTGILVQVLPTNDAIFLTLGIKEYGVSGTMHLSNTNIDLGPSEPNLLDYLPIAVLVAGIATIILGLLLKRRKRRIYRAS